MWHKAKDYMTPISFSHYYFLFRKFSSTFYFSTIKPIILKKKKHSPTRLQIPIQIHLEELKSQREQDREWKTSQLSNELGQSGCRWVELTLFSHLKKKKNSLKKCQIFKENELNQWKKRIVYNALCFFLLRRHLLLLDYLCY